MDERLKSLEGKFDELSKMITEFHVTQKVHNERMEKEVGALGRGFYGDGPNEVPGVLQRQKSQLKDIEDLTIKQEKFEQKIIRYMYFGGGFLFCIQLIWIVYKEVYLRSPN